MDELVKWLGQQLDEDERIARAASPGPWHVNAESDEVLAVDGITVAEGFALSGRQLRATTEHIAVHDPARVLREVDAKRRVLTRHCAAPVPPGNEWAEEYPYCAAHAYKGPDGTAVYPVELEKCPELRDLAAPYADRPGYRKGWAP